MSQSNALLAFVGRVDGACDEGRDDELQLGRVARETEVGRAAPGPQRMGCDGVLGPPRAASKRGGLALPIPG